METKVYGSITITDVTDGKDGAGIKKINTSIRSQPMSIWRDDYAKRSSITWDEYAEDNSHISIGDIAYLIGQVNDVVGADGNPLTITFYGKVTAVSNAGITMIPSHYMTDGSKGADATPLYTWIKYADDASGKNMSDDSTDKAYIGIAYNKTTATESTNASDYTWTLIKGEDGAPVKNILETTQYCLGDIPIDNSLPSPPNENNSGWSSTMPNPWEVVNGKKKKTHYVWKRTKVDWSNGETTYVYVTLLSDFDVADALAQQTGTSLGEWCKAQNITIIDGSTIMTGTISADHIDANGITADKIDVSGVISAGGLAIKADIDNIEIGGRNLFKGYGEEEIELPTINGSACYQSFKDNLTFDPSETVGKEYTISFWAKSPNGTTAVRLYNINNPIPRYFAFGPVVLTESLGTEWQYLSYTFINKDLGESYSTENCNRIEIHGRDQTGVLVKKIKVEMGNKATDWTPAPEDMATAAELRVANDSISTKVESSTYNSKMKQLDSAISTKVESSTYESGLTQLADQMVAKVHNKSTGDNCSWNMSPNEFKVSAVASGKEGGITVNEDGLTVNGIINAQSGGTIGGWTITGNSLETSTIKLYGEHSEKIYLPEEIDEYQIPIKISVGEESVALETGENKTISSHPYEFNIINIHKLYGLTKGQTIQLSLPEIEGKIMKSFDVKSYGLYIQYSTNGSDVTGYIQVTGINFFGSVSIECEVLKSFEPTWKSANAIYIYGKGDLTYREAKEETVPTTAILKDGTIHGRKVIADSLKSSGFELATNSYACISEPALGGFHFISASAGQVTNTLLGISGLYELSDETGGSYPMAFGRKKSDSGIGHDMHKVHDYSLVEGMLLTKDGTVEIRSGENKGLYFNNYLYTDSAASDARLKHSIEDLDVQYETLFDTLHPVRYKYIDGTSDRYHTGYIAQETVSALEAADLSTKDFAGVVLDKPGSDSECWYLRRDEFVALNTWQIQKLKKRVAELEAKNLELEERLIRLESLMN